MAFALLVEQLLVTRGDVTDDDRRAVLAVVITVVDSATAEELWPKFLRNIIDQMSTGSPELEAQKQRIRDRLARIGI